MKESFPSKNIESSITHERKLEQAYKKRYETISAAKPRMFNSFAASGEVSESPFVFAPVVINVNPEVVENLTQNKQYTGSEFVDLQLAKRLAKLSEVGINFGDYEVTCVMRDQDDTNRVDKMIAQIDENEPWQVGSIEHLFVLAEKNPELFDEPTVALGSETKQKGDIPCLLHINGRINYFEHPRDAGFNSNYRFLIVRKRG